VKEAPVFLESRDIISQPVDVVYPLIRDRLDLLVPYLPSVKRIEEISRADGDDGRLEVVNHWYTVADVPGPVKKVIKPEMFSWKDYASWNDSERRVDFRLESFLARDLYDARGTNYFNAIGEGKTQLRVTCEVEIHPERVPGVPKVVLRKTLPLIEKVIRQLLEPNLQSVGKGLTAYFRDQQARAS
jgi:hypothetical protein